jgi:hypothetical protein
MELLAQRRADGLVVLPLWPSLVLGRLFETDRAAGAFGYLEKLAKQGNLLDGRSYGFSLRTLVNRGMYRYGQVQYMDFVGSRKMALP